MKTLIITICFIMLSITQIYGRCGEIWFMIDDDNNSNYKIIARRINLNEPLFGDNFMAVDTDQYNEVISDQNDYGAASAPWDFLLGFDYLNLPNNACWPYIGEGKLEFSIYIYTPNNPNDTTLVFRFSIDLVHFTGSPDITFKYTSSTGTLTGEDGSTGIQTDIYFDDFVNCWDILGHERDISNYINSVELTNFVATGPESTIKNTITSADLGFPDETAEIGVQYDPGTVVNLWRGVYYGITTTHTTITKNNTVYNFRNWNNYENFSNSTTLRVLDRTSEFRAMFQPTEPLTISSYLEGGSSSDEYQLTWQNTQITETLQLGNVYNAFDYQLNEDKYSATIPSQIQALNNTWNFIEWEDGLQNTTRSNIQVTEPTNISAKYKGSLTSNTDFAFYGPSQRKIARTSEGYYHLVYESMGKVWYEVNISNGWHFIPPVDVEPILALSSSDAKYPSIAVNGINSLVVYQENVNGQADIALKYLYSNFSVSERRIPTSESYSVELTPVASFSTSNEFMVVWKSSDGLKYQVYQIENNQIGNSIDSGNIPNTASVSRNPSIAGTYNTGLSSTQYHIVWQDGVNSIKYVMYYNGGGTKFFYANTVSSSSGYENHWNPEVVISGSTVYVGWVGQRYEAGEEEPGPIQWKTNAFGGGGGSFGEWKERGLLGSFNGSSWNGISKALGSDVDDVALNTAGSSVVFAYYTETSLETYYTRGVQSGDGFNTIFNISEGGKSFMLSNGSSLNNMKWFDVDYPSEHLQPLGPPYSLKNGNIATQYKQGSTENYALIGREGVTTRDSVQFYFTFGEIIVDGVQVNFVELPDTMKEIKNSNQLNKFLVSEPFTLDDNSQFTYGVMCGVADSADVEVALEKNKYINFKVELIEDQSQKVLGVYDNVTFTSDSINYYSNKNYQVDTKGIGNKTVRLRLQVKDNFKQNYSIGNLLVEDSLMYKKGYHELNYKGELLVKDYDLVQNYPNPFNPATTIKYQIPKSGHVKLRVYDILGREVTTLVNEYLEDGRYEAVFNANELSSGVYIYRLEVNDFVTSKKIMLVK